MHLAVTDPARGSWRCSHGRHQASLEEDAQPNPREPAPLAS